MPPTLTAFAPAFCHRTASTLNSGLVGHPWSTLEEPPSECERKWAWWEGFDWGSTTVVSLKWYSEAEDAWYCQPWARWSCSEFQLSPTKTSDKPLSVQAVAHFMKFTEAPPTATAPSSLSCHSDESSPKHQPKKTNTLPAPFDGWTSTPDLRNAWEGMPPNVPPPPRPPHLSDHPKYRP